MTITTETDVDSTLDDLKLQLAPTLHKTRVLPKQEVEGHLGNLWDVLWLIGDLLSWNVVTGLLFRWVPTTWGALNLHFVSLNWMVGVPTSVLYILALTIAAVNRAGDDHSKPVVMGPFSLLHSRLPSVRQDFRLRYEACQMRQLVKRTKTEHSVEIARGLAAEQLLGQQLSREGEINLYYHLASWKLETAIRDVEVSLGRTQGIISKVSRLQSSDPFIVSGLAKMREQAVELNQAYVRLRADETQLDETFLRQIKELRSLDGLSEALKMLGQSQENEEILERASKASSAVRAICEVVLANSWEAQSALQELTA